MSSRIFSSVLYVVAMALAAPLFIHAQGSTAQVWVRRTVVPTSVNYEGAPTNTRATVNLWSWASGDSVVVGNPIDVLFACDLSGSMNATSGNPSRWRLTWAQISARRFIDSLNSGYDRVGVLGWSADGDHTTLADTSNASRYLQRWFPLSDDFEAAKDYIAENLHLDGAYGQDIDLTGDTLVRSDTIPGGTFDDTPLRISTVVGLNYLKNNAANPSVLILLTDGENDDNVSDQYIYRFVDSMYTNFGIRTYAIGFQGGNMGFLRTLADTGGGAAYEANTPADLDSIFNIISFELSSVVAVKTAPGEPMFVDVLGPGIHYVPGTFRQVSSLGGIRPSFRVDTVDGLTRINLSLDTVRLGELFLVMYDITAAVTFIDTASSVLVRTNNAQLDNDSNYSHVEYMDVNSTIMEKPIPQNFITVKCGISALHLSLRPDTLIPPSQTKVVPLEYTSAAPAVFPNTTLYALLQLDLTDTVVYVPATVTWNFNPVSGWTAPTLYNVQGRQEPIGITVPYDNAGLCTLTIEYPVQGTIYRDYLVFSAFEQGAPERVIGIVIDDDTLTPEFMYPPRLTVTGNRTQLNAYSQPLYARGVTNYGNIHTLPAAWSVSGFSIYQSQLSGIFTGTHQNRTLDLVVRDTTFAQSDSGYIRVDSGGLSFSLNVAVYDTSFYNSVTSIAIFGDFFGGNADSLAAHYLEQQSQVEYSLAMGDSLTFWSLLFDDSRTVPVYMGAGNAIWRRAGDSAVIGPSFVISGGKPLQQEQLTVTYVNRTGDTLTDTVTILWGFGSMRYVSLESRPGIIGDTASSPLTTLVVPSNADTVRGIYVVVRDEFGNCVYSGSADNVSDYAAWSVSTASALAYADVPADTTSIGWIHRKTTPASPTTFYLVATGVNLTGLYNRKDSIAVTFLSYSFDSLIIRAAASPTPVVDTARHTYAVGEDIPKSALLFLTAGADTVVLQAQVRRQDNQAWQTLPVSWMLSDMSIVEEPVFAPDSQVTIVPVRNISRDALIAYLDFGGGIVVSDTVYCMVDISFIDSFVIVFPDYPIVAGDTFSFTIIAIDQNGDTVRNPVRLPSGYTLSLNTLLLLMGTSDTLLLNDTTAGITDPFLNGISINNGVLYLAGDNLLVISFTYPTKTGTATYTDTIRISVQTGPPDSIAIIREKDSTLAVSDTLSSIHTSASDSVLFYQIVLYDRFGNPIPASSGFYDSLLVTVSGTLDPASIIRDGNRIGYSAANALDGANGTITVRYTGPSADITYSFDLLIVPVAQVLLIETHEWVPDTISGVALIRTVLDSVLGIDPDSLWAALQASGSSQNQAYLGALQSHGYMPYRDGYLDYLDITLSMPYVLREDYISAIRFDAQTLNGLDSVLWRVSDAGRTIRLLPRGPGNTLWRLWLMTNAGQNVRAPLETGLLPSVSFDNNAIRQANSQTNFPVLIGADADVYTTDMALTVDSTPPVIAGFRFQNNACKPGEPENKIYICFSEPVATASIPAYSSVTSFVIEYRTRIDSGFMSTAIIEGDPSTMVYDTLEAWNLDGSTAYCMTYEAVINKDSNGVFIPEMTKIRFSVIPSNTQCIDATGNRGCVSANRKAALSAQGETDAYVCSLTGTSISSRYDAMTFAWGRSSADGVNQDVPLFHFFGFTVNMLQIVADNPRTFVIVDDALIGGRHFVVCDFDTAMPLIETAVKIYDVFGNLVASPSTNAALSASFTVSSLREFMGFASIEDDISSLSLDEIQKSYTVSEADSPADPDTLRPLYPTTLTLGYDYLAERCGPATGRDLCMPSWNCLNAKGRLVAPGGYVGAQDIRTGATVTEAVRKILVTSGPSRKSSY